MEERITPQRSKNTDVIITLLVLIVMSLFFYGARVLMLALIAIICCGIADYLSVRVIGFRRWMMNDFSQIITALVITCLLPASAPYWLVAIASFFAIFVAKMPFGGFGKNIFNPAAVAYAFVAICWPQKVLMYPIPFEQLPITSEVPNVLVNAPTRILSLGGVPNISILDALLGDYSGPLGTSCVILIVMCGIYMIVRKTIAWRVVIPALLTVVAIAGLFPRTTAEPAVSIMDELFSGMIVFVIVFMATDMVTSPEEKGGQVLYGVALGFSMMMFRYFGQTEVAEIYALILLNPFKNKWGAWSDVAITKCKELVAFCKTKISKDKEAE